MGLEAEWTAAVRALGGDPGVTGTDLVLRYAEPHRSYHTGGHAEAVVRDVAWLAGQQDLEVPDRHVITLAACAHDVVYDARPGHDERASADWARAALAGLDPAVIERVAAMVLATADHIGAPADLATAVLLDADLSILGAPPAVYAAYAEGVRAEYAQVTEGEWRAGRSAVLRRLLGADPLYRTEPARRRWAAAADANIRAELATLHKIETGGA